MLILAPASVTTTEIKNQAVTAEKLAPGIIFGNAPEYGVTVGMFGAWGENETAQTNVATLNAAIASLPASGGRVILPSGSATITAPETTHVAADEGACVQITSGANIKICGQGKGLTALKSASNKLEMIVIAGANNVILEDMTFDNSAHGLLQNQPKMTVNGNRNGGVAGLGNAANSAIRQYSGAGLTVRSVDFKAFIHAIHYIGDEANDQVLSGDCVVENCGFEGCVQGLLCEQPETLVFKENWEKNTVDSVNADASRDPGHSLYVTNRPGASPRSIIVANHWAHNCDSSTIKVRKGVSVSCSNVAIYECGRGIEFFNVENLSVGQVTGTMKEVATDSNQCFADIVDCGNYRLSGLCVDVSGAGAWALRIRSDEDSKPFHNTFGTVENCSLQNDFSGGVGKAFVLAKGQRNLTIKGVRCWNKGTIASTRHPFDVHDCTKTRIFDCEHVSLNSDAYAFAKFHSGCVGCCVEYRVEDLSTAPTSSTIVDLATNTTIRQIN